MRSNDVRTTFAQVYLAARMRRVFGTFAVVGQRTVDQLRRGARMHSLMYAAYLAKNPSRQYDVTWSELTYTRNSASGARGSVAFSRAGAVALFYDETRFGQAKKPLSREAHLAGLPDLLLRTAKDLLLPNYDRVTAAFWSDRDGAIVGARPWARLVEDGAHLVAEELDKPVKALSAWAAQYALPAELAAVALEVFLPGGNAGVLSARLPTKGKVPPAAQRVVVSAAQRAALGIIPNGPTRELLAGAAIVLE
jgi:hypothetical protein